jgi:hypothetical protein
MAEWTELVDLIAIYRAIDDAVVADHGLTSTVVNYLQPYEDPRAPGWFRRTFARQFLVPDDVDDESLDAALERQLPSTEAALEDLAKQTPRGRMRSRLLLALAVLGRVRPEFQPQNGAAGLLQGALVPHLPEGQEDQVERLHQLLLDDGVFPHINQWHVLIGEAVHANLVHENLVWHPPPCHAQVVMEKVPRFGDEPVARLTTEFCIDAGQLPMDRAVAALSNPVEWHDCNPLWCPEMESVPGPAGKTCVVEVISLNCHDATYPKLAVCLCFTFTAVDNNTFYATYEMCVGQSKGNDTILVDHGSFLVERRENQTCVASTKYVRFSSTMDGPSFSLTLCSLGYGYAAQDFVLTCGLESQT